MGVAVAAIVLAVIVVWVIIAIDRRRPASAGATPRPTIVGWSTLTFGVLALIALVVPLLASRVSTSGDGDDVAVNVPLLPLASIAFSLVGVVLGGYSVRRRDRHWPVWVGLAASVLTVGFWLYFFVAELLYPH